MKIFLASNNRGKLRELERILAPLGFELATPSDLGLTDAPEENGATFEENALIKARYYLLKTGLPAIADDSGLCVDALGGEPGVRSARYSGEGATDASNNALLLARLEGTPDDFRSAHFSCSAVCIFPNGHCVTAQGRVDGRILAAPRGVSGFGYDPLFLEPVSGKTFGELDGADKDSVSHRGRAFHALAEKLHALDE
jgi:XTP/dITP diphosphohydrolase